MKSSSSVSIQYLILSGILFCWHYGAEGFSSPPSSGLSRTLLTRSTKTTSFTNHASSLVRQSTWQLFDSSSSGDEAPKRRRKRVKRKEVAAPDEDEEFEDEEEAARTVPDLKPRDDGPVQLQVQDVRDLVGGGSGAPPKATSAEVSPSFAQPSATSSMASPSTSSSPPTDTLSDDSLKMLLEDAKEFQSLEQKKDGSSSSAVASSEEGEFSIPDAFRNILSTVVTIDFFVVCAFLVWFLAGIFCSYILKDDTVQIAFNQLFQPVVQPALGILMIGAIAGSFGSKEEEETI